jgi:sulfopyruvate decarboxylase subunit alpha
MAKSTLPGPAIIAALKEAKIEFIVSVPDITSSEGLLWPIARGKDFKLVRVCKEDEGVSVCAGLAVAGRRSVLLIQHTGFLDSINAIRGIACEQSQPVCMVIGLLEKEPHVPPRQAKMFGLRIVEPILDAMAIEHFCIEGSNEIARLPGAIAEAYAASRPLAALLGQSVSP